MNKTESVEDFYKRVPKANSRKLPFNNAGVGHINVFTRDSCAVISPYMRRDYYKVTLILGKGTLHYADKWIECNRPALLFSNPKIPYSWEGSSEEQPGWFVLFTASFLSNGEKMGSIKESPLFQLGGTPLFFLDEPLVEEISTIFKKMLTEIQSDYIYKYDILRNYLHLIIHEAMKLHPPQEFQKHHNGSERITALFQELLERQFPVASPEAPLSLKTANDYATQLSVHVNHLNRSVKTSTLQTTTQHIAQRVTKEALALLQHSDWSISEIGYSLGFDNPAYFTNFLKKHTGKSPNQYRTTFV